MKNTPCNFVVKNPWRAAFRYPAPDFNISSFCYKKDNFYITKLLKDSYLYFFEKNGKYFAFNSLAELRPKHVDAVRSQLETKKESVSAWDFIAERGAEQIEKWLKEEKK